MPPPKDISGTADSGISSPKNIVITINVISAVSAPKPIIAPFCQFLKLFDAIIAFTGPGGAAKLNPSKKP
jgi:hypothetical protein